MSMRPTLASDGPVQGTVCKVNKSGPWCIHMAPAVGAVSARLAADGGGD
jgi:hypothetical protein